MQKQVDILQVPIDSLHEEDVLKKVDIFFNDSSSSPNTFFIVTANPEILLRTYEDVSYRLTIKEADLVVPDGIGVMIAGKLLGSPLQQKLPGYELMHTFLQYASTTDKSVFFYGAEPGRAKQAAYHAQSLYKGLHVAGTLDGYTGDRDDDALIISQQNPDFVFVALGAPAQELWIKQHRHLFTNTVFVGVGGSIDVLSGAIQRAPEFWTRNNLEWFYRMVTQPSRIKRVIKIPLFLLYVLKYKFRSKKTQ